jgi:hypothetical protein
MSSLAVAWVTNLLLFFAFPLPPQMDQQQHDDEPEGQQETPAAHPGMSNELRWACINGDVGKIRRCLDDGESINSVDEDGSTPIMVTAEKVGCRPDVG